MIIGLGSGAKGSTFVPTDYPGLFEWLDAMSLASITKSGPGAVSAWADLSGAHNNLTQGSALDQPIYNATSLNGRPGITPTGTQLLQNTALASPYTTGSCTVYIVCQTSNAQSIIVDSIASDRLIVYGEGAGAPVATLYINANQASSAVRTDTQARVICASPNVDGSNDKIYVDSYAAASGTVAKIGAVTIGDLVVGNANSGAQPCGGPIGEVLYYSTIHNLAERTQVMQYLGAKWGITVS